ncbi:MAG: DUF4279 domain-containing protein [Bacteroidetes bacterium]|nr:DUF4279 domain-containing protein [Bacteroidota bacterium]
MTNKPFVKVILSIYGNHLDPEIISNKVRISPSFFYRKGDLAKAGRKRKEGCWTYESGYKRTFYAGKSIDSTLALFEPYRSELKRIIMRNLWELKVEVVIKYKGHDTPSLTISKTALNFVSFLGGCIDVDLYSND